MGRPHAALSQVLSLVAVAVIALFGAGSALAAGEKLAAFYKNQVDPHFALVRAGVEAAAKEMGAGPVTHYAPTRPNNLAEQLSEIEDVTVKKPDAMLFMAVDARVSARRFTRWAPIPRRRGCRAFRCVADSCWCAR